MPGVHLNGAPTCSAVRYSSDRGWGEEELSATIPSGQIRMPDDTTPYQSLAYGPNREREESVQVESGTTLVCEL